MPPVSILLLIFSAALLLYAGLMAVTKDYKILPYRSQVSVKPKNPKAYMAQLAKVVALVAAVPAAGALAALWNGIAAAVVLIGGLIVTLWLGTKIMKKG